MQELNLAYKYSHLHWKVACLCVNAGDINDEISKATDYGAIAKAIANMDKGFVTPPYINSAKVGFTANMETETCTFGLGAVKGISTDLAKQIISLRPFSSFQDFLDKCYETKVVQPNKIYNLIKGGCFDLLDDNRVQVMAQFIDRLIPNKTKLTAANIPKLLELNCIDPKFKGNVDLYHFKKMVFDKKNVYKMVNKTQGYYKVPSIVIDYFKACLENLFIDSIDYTEEGDLILFSKTFNKTYDKIQELFMDHLLSEETLSNFNQAIKMVEWKKNCSGNISKWEMDSISYYYKGEHELKVMGIERMYTLDNFFNLPVEPVRYTKTNEKTGRSKSLFKLYTIAGTVVDKNKNKSMITINTIDGVVEVKFSREAFAHYDKKTEEEASWFSRGNKLILIGYRRGETFYPRTHEDSVFRTPVMKIEVDYENQRLDIKNERIGEEEFYY